MADPTTPDATKQRILDALVDLLADAGSEAVSVRRVAAGANVSIGAVQHHFPTRDDLVVAAMIHVGELTQNSIAEMARSHSNPFDSCQSVCRALAAAADDDLRASRVWLAFVAHAANNPRVARIHAELWQRAEDELAGMIDAMTRNGGHPLSPDDVKDRAAVLLACLDGIAVARIVEPERMSRQRAERVADQALVAALAAPDPAAHADPLVQG